MLDGTNWYQLSVQKTFEELETDSSGLTSSEAKTRLEKHGYNELKFRKPSVIMRFLRQFHNPLVYILLAAAAITGVLYLRGEDMVVILNAILGYFQEGKTEAALEALRKMIVP